jgi:hypothetical protein
MPPIRPDPDAIDHLEGNKRVIRRYREHALADLRRSQEENESGERAD